MTGITSKKASSTEEKIKNAAREVFVKKGYAATRTRDIAEASGENLALINYYFKSKENLYRLIMIETMGDFISTILHVFNDEKTTLEEKIQRIVANYIDLFIQRPDMPLFVINEVNNNADNLLIKNSMREKMLGTLFFKQLSEKLRQNNKQIHPIQMFMNMMGMVIFPFMASPMIKGMTEINRVDFEAIMKERKTLIPMWTIQMLEV